MIDEHAYPNTAAGHRHGVCLPLHGAVSIEDVARVAGLIREHQSAFA